MTGGPGVIDPRYSGPAVPRAVPPYGMDCPPSTTKTWPVM